MNKTNLTIHKRNGKYGFVDSTNKTVIPHKFDEIAAASVSLDPFGIEYFANDIANVRIGSKWGYIDIDGNTIVSPQFDHSSLFVNGIAIVDIDGKYGYLKNNGAYIAEPKFDQARPFYKGYALVEEDGRWSVIDLNGNYAVDREGKAIERRFDYVWEFSNGVAAARIHCGDSYWDNPKCGYIDPKGEWVIAPK